VRLWPGVRHSFAPSYFVVHQGCDQVGGRLTSWLAPGTVVYRPDWVGAKQRHEGLTRVQLMPAAGLGAEHLQLCSLMSCMSSVLPHYTNTTSHV
jgi:hypothetical protein